VLRRFVDADGWSAAASAGVAVTLETNPGEVESLKELLGHRSILTTQLYLRRLDRGVAMEHVRSLDWSEIAAKPFDALREAEKEGFEPSMEAFTPITP
jgi:hypothetical protein